MFDQGLGDLFVIRVAGNIVAPSQVGSVEFAAARFNTRLVVVLGHSQCGAITATLEELSRTRRDPVARTSGPSWTGCGPSVEALLETDVARDPEPRCVHHAVRANIRASANHLRHGSAILEQLIAEDGLLVVGAEYSLETGRRGLLRRRAGPDPTSRPTQRGRDPRREGRARRAAAGQSALETGAVPPRAL